MASTALMEATREEVRRLEGQARELEVKAVALRDDKAKNGINPITDKAAFEEVNEAFKAVGLVNNQIKDLSAQMMAAQGWEAGPANGNVADPTAMDFGAYARAARLFGRRPERMGGLFVKSDAYKELRAKIADSSDAVFNQVMAAGISPVLVADREALLNSYEMLATTVTGGSATSAGPFIQNDLIPGFIAYQRKRPLMQSLIPWGTTDSDVVEYVNQTAVSSSAAEAAETDAAAEGAIAFETLTTNVQEVTHFIPVTRRAMADHGQISSIIDNDLVAGAIDRVDTQLYGGNGTPPNLKGITAYSGIGTQPLGGDTRPDAIMKAATTIRIAAGVLGEPDYIGMHPTDWQSVRLEKDANDNYLFGPPNMPGPREAWGIPVVVSTVFTQGQPLMGDFAGSCRGWVREGISVSTGLNGDDFKYRRVSMLASMRLAFAVTRAGGFCVITGF